MLTRSIERTELKDEVLIKTKMSFLEVIEYSLTQPLASTDEPETRLLQKCQGNGVCLVDRDRRVGHPSGCLFILT